VWSDTRPNMSCPYLKNVYHHIAKQRCYLFQQSAVLLCTEGHGKFISAAEIACQETFLMRGLSFLVFEPVCVLGSLHTKRHKSSAGCSKVVSVVLAALYKAFN